MLCRPLHKRRIHTEQDVQCGMRMLRMQAFLGTTTMKLKSITDKEFNAEVMNSGLLTLVLFQADWSWSCKIVNIALESVGEECYGLLKMLTMDIDRCTETVRALKILPVPTVVYFENGKEIRRDVGLMSVRYMGRTIKELLVQAHQTHATEQYHASPGEKCPD
jgi:thioredoxin 1